LANIFSQLKYLRGKLQTYRMGEATHSRLCPYLKY